MAELSYWFDGTTLGDADQAPYVSETEFMLLFDMLHSDSDMKGFCLPEFWDSLFVESADPTLGKVTVNTGAAYIYGQLYTNDTAVDVSIPVCAANPRIDYITLRTSNLGNTIRITRVAGAEAANPSFPAIPATDIPLAWLYVPTAASYDPTTDVFPEHYIHDQRQFGHLGPAVHKYNNENVMPNSEFMAFSCCNIATNEPPEYWDWDNTGLSFTDSAPMTSVGQTRGKSVIMNGNNTDSFQTLRLAIPRGKIGDILTIVIPYNVTNFTEVTVTEYGGATITKWWPKFNTDLVEVIRLPLSLETTHITLHFEILSGAGEDIQLGQIMVINGWVQTPFHLRREFIMYEQDLTDTNWNDTAKSDGITTLQLDATFPNPGGETVPDGVWGIIARIRGRDSASAATASNYMEISQTNAPFDVVSGRVEVCGTANDTYRDRVVYVPLYDIFNTKSFDAQVDASGAGTFDATIQPIGILT